MIFPQYRKLSNHKSFYKIVSKEVFEEIQLVGTVSMKTKTTATKYPEILRIKDMLDGAAPFEMSTEAEYNSHQ
tara:strand:- start:212 stop:430 length:219 start_codon:yes stop_codon:yes gene_type:complete